MPEWNPKDKTISDEARTKFQEVATTLLRDRAFALALDELSVTVMDSCESFVESHIEQVVAAGFEGEQAALLMAMVVGWILGFHEDLYGSHEERMARVGEQLLVAATAAGWSAGNTSGLHARARH